MTDDEAIRAMQKEAMYWAATLSRAVGRKHLRDDLLQEGLIGAVAAARTFDQSAGTKFETYAAPRVRGRMLDYIRQTECPLSRTHYNRCGSAPVHVSAYGRNVAQALATRDPELDDATDEVLAVLRRLKVSMTELEQRAVLLYFVGGKVLAEVARDLNVSASYAQLLVRNVIVRGGGSGRLGYANGSPANKKRRVRARRKTTARVCRLGMSLVRPEHGGVSVVECPHCGRERRVSMSELAYWEKIGRVTPCGRECVGKQHEGSK